MKKILVLMLAAVMAASAVGCVVTDSEGRGFESLRAGHKKPHEIAVFRLFQRFLFFETP